jgi:hypothetical protein
MISECKRKRVIVFHLTVARFLLFLFIIPFNVFCQPTDSLRISGKLGFEYFDIFRQRSDRISSTILARSFDAALTLSKGCDTMSLVYSGWNQYGSYNSFNSQFGSAIEDGLRSFSLQWISSASGWFDYSGTLLIPVERTFFPVRSFGGWIRLKPFGEALKGLFTYEKIPASFTSGLRLEDFLVRLSDENDRAFWSIEIQARPLENLEGSFAFGKSGTVIEKTNELYSSQLDWNSESFSALLRFNFDGNSSAWLGYLKTDNKGTAALNRDGLMFGYLTDGDLARDKLYGGINAAVFTLPFSFEYSYYRWKGSGVGEIESWPFTPVAASVFSNRLYYEVNGRIDIHRIESSVSINAGNLQIEPSLGILTILSDIALKHWEPQFLVFFNNVKIEPFSIEQSLLIRLGCGFKFRVFGVNTAVQLEQFIPLYIKYIETGQSSQGPGSTAASGGSSSTDGGRRIKVVMSLQ